MIKIQIRAIAVTVVLCLCLLFGLCVTPALANAKAASSDPPTASTTTSASTTEASAQKPPSKVVYSDAEIAAAKSSGKVWVNLDSGIFHKRGRWYGKTKNGKFMTPDEAKKAGYRQAKRE